MRLFLIALLCSTASMAFAQAPNPDGYGVTFKGDTVWIYGPVSMGAQFLTFYDINNKEVTESQSKLKDMYLGDSHFINNSIGSMGMKRLQRVVLQNDKYILTTYFGGPKWMYYIYNRNTMETEVNKKEHSKSQKHDLKSLDEVLSQYFGDCTEALAVIRNSIQTSDYRAGYRGIDEIMFKNITNYDCSAAGKSDK